MNSLALVASDAAGTSGKRTNFSCRLAQRRRARVCQLRANVARDHFAFAWISRLRSTVGRPRRVTDAQIRIILAWRAEMLELQARRKAIKTIQQLASELQLSPSTISDVVRKHGSFKQPSPELREATIVRRRAVLADPRQRRTRPKPLTAAQTAAIERWWSERQAVRESMWTLVSKAKMARELRMAQATLDRILARNRRSPSTKVCPTTRTGRARVLSARQAMMLVEWEANRSLMLAQRARAPGMRTFARQLGIGLSVLRRVVAGLKARP